MSSHDPANDCEHGYDSDCCSVCAAKGYDSMNYRQSDPSDRFYLRRTGNSSVRCNIYERVSLETPKRGAPPYLRVETASEADFVCAALNAADRQEKECTV